MTWEPDPLEPEDRDEDLAGDAEVAPVVTVEISGLSLYTRHGVSEAERELGQRLVFDVSFELDECDATVTDRVEDTVDYADVCEQVALAAQERSYKTLERLCAASPSASSSATEPTSVRVKAAKPEPPMPLPVEEVSVEVGRDELTRLPRPRLERGRPAGEPARGARRARRTGVTQRVLVGLRDRAAGRGARPAGLPQRRACEIETELGPEELLEACKQVERELGRAAGGLRHGPRPIDIDVLLLGDLEYESERLTLPHRESRDRRFVLEPLMELDPD